MEQFNSKLYDNYQKEKRKRILDEDEWLLKINSDFKAHKMASEEMIENLNTENDRLREEITSIQEKCNESEKLLLEESQKTNELSFEVGRLQHLLSQRIDNNYDDLLGSRCSKSPSRQANASKTSQEDTLATPLRSSPCLSSRSRNVPKAYSEKNVPSSENRKDEVKHIVPPCCRRRTTYSGDISDTGSCIFQALIESLIGMDFDVGSQDENSRLLIVHRTSGYSFSLTWIATHEGGEGELLYEVSSLGTLERVAPDWMKEEVVFGMAMCRIFFERISRVTGSSR